jgi:hypothetical protein
MHSHSLRGRKKHSSPQKNKNLQKKKKKMGCRRIKTARKQESSAYHNNKKKKAAPPKIQNCSDPCKILAKEKFDLKNRAQQLPTQKSSFPHSTIHAQTKIED